MTTYVYVLKVWLEPAQPSAPLRAGEDGSPHVWRASLTNTATKDKHYFSTPEALAAFLPQLASLTASTAMTPIVSEL